MNEVIERRLAKCADDVLKFDDELAQAKESLKQNPTNANASAVSIAREKLEGARLALSEAEAEKARAEAIIKSSEYKSAVKRISEIDKESEKLKDIVLTKFDDLYQAIDNLDELAKGQKKLIAKYKTDDIAFLRKGQFRRIFVLQSKLSQWRKDWKAYNTPPRQAIPVKHNYTSEQKKAMAERYKPADELNAMLARKWAKEDREE